MTSEVYMGLMTGTSMDGIDAALLAVDADRFRLHATRAVPWPRDVRERLLAVTARTPLEEVMALDALVGDALADAACALMGAAGASPPDVRAIGSHGQTLWHAPRRTPTGTLQVGDPSRIAEATGVDVVADFRRRDMAAGGEGAPLAPAFHHAFFTSPSIPRVAVNLGGMANVTILPAACGVDTVTGFDTGPGNALMDAWHQRHRGGPFDPDGRWAASGTIQPHLLATLRRDPYFSAPPPKSTGRDDFHPGWLEAAGVDAWDPVDVQATLAELTATTVADAVRAALPGVREVIACGGGAHNGYLLDRITRALPGVTVTSSATLGVDPDWVEAAGFAWLARETLAGRPGNIPGVTGARARVPLGAVYPGVLRAPRDGV